MLKDVFKKQVQAGDEVVLLVKEYGYRKMSDSYLGNAIYIGEGSYGHEFINKNERDKWLEDPKSVRPYRQKRPECVLIRKATAEFKTRYISIERQGNVMWLIKTEASSYEEAEAKALKAIHANDDISEVTKEQAKEAADPEIGLYIIDENGDEVDDEEDDLYD